MAGVGTFIDKCRWLALACLLLPSLGFSAGLGKLTVHSALGQPLKAEIEVVSLQAGEADSLSARLAPVEAFRQADIDFNGALLNVKFAIERRPGGQHVVVLTSTQPLNEPFFDMLVEVNWSSGKLVREYTFLLDPPEYHMPTLAAAKPALQPSVAQTAPAPVPAPAEPAPQAAAPAEPTPQASAPADAAPQPSASAEPGPQGTSPTEAPTSVQPAPPAATPPEEHPLVSEPPKTAETYEVKHGDTLAKIAIRNKIEGVTLQQMLVALFRANQDAFVGDNMNRLRTGKILTLPDKEAALSIGSQDARRLVTAQSADFADYRRSLGLAVAQAPARGEAGRQASGKISAPTEQTPPPAKEPAKDQLRLSRSDDAGRGGKAAGTAAADDQAARDKALKEANERVAILEKNVADMKKLLELKNSAAAQAQQQAQAAKAAPPAAPAPAPAATPAAAKPMQPEAAAKAPAAKAAEPAAKASEPAKVADAGKAPAEPAKAVPAAPAATQAVKAPATAAPKAAPRVAPIAPAPEAGFFDELLGNEVALAGAAGVIVLLAFYAVYAWRKKKREAGVSEGIAGSSPADVNSVLGVSGGRDVDTGSSSFQSDFSQSGIGKIDTEEIDPLAEADVYMAYGRDAQAEEILKEALAKDSSRHAIRVKLLEIYANRKDTKAFEAAAGELHDATGGRGPEWEKAVKLGLGIDPHNTLYGGRKTDELTHPEVPSNALAMPDIALPVTEMPQAAPALDFNLDLGGGGSGGEAQPDITLDVDAPAHGDAAPAGLDFDLGLGGDKPAGDTSGFSPGGTLINDQPLTPEPSAGADAPLNIDFDLPGMDKPAPAAPAPAAAPAAAADAGDGSINFDLSGFSSPASQPKPEPAKETALDLSAISLDMDTEAAAAPAGGGDGRWQEVATKLDLAKAYEEMGDKDGARELLKEVVKEGDSAQQQRAQTMLQALG